MDINCRNLNCKFNGGDTYLDQRIYCPYWYTERCLTTLDGNKAPRFASIRFAYIISISSVCGDSHTKVLLSPVYKYTTHSLRNVQKRQKHTFPRLLLRIFLPFIITSNLRVPLNKRSIVPVYRLVAISITEKCILYL